MSNNPIRKNNILTVLLFFLRVHLPSQQDHLMQLLLRIGGEHMFPSVACYHTYYPYPANSERPPLIMLIAAGHPTTTLLMGEL